MDNRALKLSDQPAHLSAIPSNHHWLPAKSYKNSAALKLELNQHLINYRPDNKIRSELATHVAAVISNMHIDYAAKLDLIRVACNHPVFKRAGKAKWFLHIMYISLLRGINAVVNPAANKKLTGRSDAQLILAAAKSAIIQSRAKVILC
jgi:hypothetical protein